MQLMIYMAQNPLSYNKEGSAVNMVTSDSIVIMLYSIQEYIQSKRKTTFI